MRGALICGGIAAGLFLGTGTGLQAQILLGGNGPGVTARIFQTDLAVLEAGEPRKDLPCEVMESKPMLGFDLRFHTGYEVSVPLSELAGTENLLTILFRVYQKGKENEPVYFTQKIRVPAITEDAKGDAYLSGTFEVGEGGYKVEWLMRDRSERVCSSSWEVEAVLPPKDKQVELAIPSGVIQVAEREQFKDEPPIARVVEEQPLAVKMLVNFAPQSAHSASLQPFDTSALVSILRSISRDPRIGKFSLVAFNLQERRVIFRQDGVDKIDFPALGEAIESVNPGTVDLKRLSEKNGEASFLTELMQKELAAPADAIVFAGPKAMLDVSVPQESLKLIGDLASPVFYMNYNLYPQSVPWTDSIGKAVKFFRGYEYTISRPRDLWFAVSEMVTRIVKLKHGRRSGTSSE